MLPFAFGRLTLCACSVWLALTQRAGAEPLETFVLENGLRVLLQQDRSQPVVGVAVGYGKGALHDPPGRAELAHVSEHLMMLARAPHTGSTWERLWKLGADQGATTYETEVLTHAQLPNEHLETALWVESERMAFSLQSFDEALLERTKKVVQREWHERCPDFLIESAELIEEAVYGSDHAPLRYVTRRPNLANIRLNDVHWWMQTVVRPSNAVLSIVGDFDVPATKELVQRYFGPIVAAPTEARNTPALQTNYFATTLTSDQTLTWSRSMTIVEWPVQQLPLAKAYALDIAATLLEDELRIRLGDMITWLDVSFEEHTTHARFVVRFARQINANPIFMVHELDAILNNFRPSDIPQRGFESTRAARILRLITEQEDFARRASLSALRALHASNATYEERLTALRALTGQDLEQTVHATLLSQPRVVILPDVKAVKAHRGALR